MLSLLFQLFLLLGVHAHYQLQFPSPRGAFVADKEPTFCDGYTTVASNRTSLAMKNSYISLNSGHPNWVVTVLLSNSSNPQSFDDFVQVTSFTKNTGTGVFCLPFDLSSSNVTSVIKDGQNATLQILYAADDGNLYQCADVTLSNSTTNNQAGTNCTAGDLKMADGTSQTPGGNNSERLASTYALGVAITLALVSILLTV